MVKAPTGMVTGVYHTGRSFASGFITTQPMSPPLVSLFEAAFQCNSVYTWCEGMVKATTRMLVDTLSCKEAAKWATGLSFLGHYRHP